MKVADTENAVATQADSPQNNWFDDQDMVKDKNPVWLGIIQKSSELVEEGFPLGVFILKEGDNITVIEAESVEVRILGMSIFWQEITKYDPNNRPKQFRDKEEAYQEGFSDAQLMTCYNMHLLVKYETPSSKMFPSGPKGKEEAWTECRFTARSTAAQAARNVQSTLRNIANAEAKGEYFDTSRVEFELTCKKMVGANTYWKPVFTFKKLHNDQLLLAE